MSERLILSQLHKAAEDCDAWAAIPELRDEAVGVHVAVMAEPFLRFILDGTKTIESRFSRNAITPYQRVSMGDLVFLKSGPVVGSFRVSSTEFIVLDDGKLEKLRRDYGAAICARDEEFWTARADKRYATLMGIGDVRRLPPVKVSKSCRRGWVTLRPSHADVDPQLMMDSPEKQPGPRQMVLPLPAGAMCADGHLFRPPGDDPPGPCLHCGIELVDWARMHRRQATDWEYTFSCLSSEQIRRDFWTGDIDERATEFFKANADRIRERALQRLKQSVSKVYGSGPDARPYRDGYQTPKAGSIIFYAQHSLACCCRRCMRYWHAIPYGRALRDSELEYFADLIVHYVRIRMGCD